MATLQLFATPQELYEPVQDLTERHSLVGLTRAHQDYNICSFAEVMCDAHGLGDIANPMYLLPNNEPFLAVLTEEAFEPRTIGAIKIDFGRLINKDGTSTLLMTSISAEDKQELAFKPASWLRQSRRRLEADGGYKFGVEGINTAYGGKDTYKSIGYSPLALSLLQANTRWKQFIEGNVEFYPLNYSKC